MYDSWRNVTTLEEHWRKRKKGKSVRNKARKQKLFQELILNWIICTLWKTKRCIKIQSLLTRYFHLSFILSLTIEKFTSTFCIRFTSFYQKLGKTPPDCVTVEKFKAKRKFSSTCSYAEGDQRLCWGRPAATLRATCGYAEGLLTTNKQLTEVTW